MNLLARLDSGDAVLRALLVASVQISVVILLAALLSRVALRRRADVRHVLWLGVLVWVLISPAVAAVADGSGLDFWVVKLPFPGPGATSAVIEIIPDAAVVEDRGLSHRSSQSDSIGLAGDQARASAPVGAEPSNDSVARPRAERVDTEASRGDCRKWAAGAMPSSEASFWSGRRVRWPDSFASSRVGGGSRRSLGQHSRSIRCVTARPSNGSAMCWASPCCLPWSLHPKPAGQSRSAC